MGLSVSSHHHTDDHAHVSLQNFTFAELRTNLPGLSRDVFALILCRLELKDLSVVARVCQTWRREMRSSAALWTHHYNMFMSVVATEEELPRLMPTSSDPIQLMEMVRNLSKRLPEQTFTKLYEKIQRQDEKKHRFTFASDALGRIPVRALHCPSKCSFEVPIEITAEVEGHFGLLEGHVGRKEDDGKVINYKGFLLFADTRPADAVTAIQQFIKDNIPAGAPLVIIPACGNRSACREQLLEYCNENMIPIRPRDKSGDSRHALEDLLMVYHLKKADL